MRTAIKPQKRWMTAALQTSSRTMPDLPFKGGQRGALALRPSCPASMLLRRA